MKPAILRHFPVIVLLALTAGSLSAVTVTSPNKAVSVDLANDAQGRLSYSVTVKEKHVIEKSRIAITVDGTDLSEGVEFGPPGAFEVNGQYQWRGVHSQAVNHGRGTKIPVTHTATKTAYTV